jgi:hypothetical protein
MELFAWWNLIFVLPFVAGLLYLLLLAAGIMAEGHDTEFHADTDVAHDFGVEHSVDVGHGHDATHAGHESGLLFKALSFLGVGKVGTPPLILCHSKRSTLRVSFDCHIKLPGGLTHANPQQLGPTVPQP